MSRCHHTEQELEALQTATLLCSAAWIAVQSVVSASLAGRTLRRRGLLFELVRKGGKRNRQRASYIITPPDVACKPANLQTPTMGDACRPMQRKAFTRRLELDQVRSGHGPDPGEMHYLEPQSIDLSLCLIRGGWKLPGYHLVVNITDPSATPYIIIATR
ncbi:hypothetical protein FHL15_002716 [Xylaria flabelliformis]|uniref:Uncharacterized protein n=1 Tax=Xylaria flabelliformis TaxID=2512241 RepID=A0A553I8C4_9PEZI|nr:hypothetical protein FHL15_002716 [Xylaria flabelliformis]